MDMGRCSDLGFALMLRLQDAKGASLEDVVSSIEQQAFPHTQA